MDIEMPKMDGLQAAQIAIDHSPNMIFIAITSYSDNVYLMDLLKVGFKGCIFKNNIYEELVTTIWDLSNNKIHFPKDILIIDKKRVQTKRP